MNKLRFLSLTFVTVAAAAIITSCDRKDAGWEYARNMYDPIAYNPDQPNNNFRNGQTAQVPPPNTTPVGWDKEESFPNSKEGYMAAGAQMKNPLKVDSVNLAEGKALYVNMCSHCHGYQGKGDGSIVKLEKFPAPPSYSSGTSSRGGAMKDLNDGKIFHTITNGVNLMGPHKYQLTPTERWKIVMYVHELQKLK